MNLRIGIDLDNTIIRYDHAFAVAARERGLIPEEFTGAKQQIRDHIRLLPGRDGETEWQKLQGHVYGSGIRHAELFPHVTAFLKRAKTECATIYIVSHKTQFGHFDPEQVDLREAARGFLEAEGIFDYLSPSHLLFCADRAEKLRRIAALKCDVFVDDLEEVLADPDFPPGVRRLLFAAEPAHDLEHVCDWTEVERSVFSDVETEPARTASFLLKRKVDRVVRTGGGGNSRIYRVEAGGETYALKMYPSIERDSRDRLGVEKKALRLFERHGIANVPRWLGDCPGHALLTWVEGEPANPPMGNEIERAVAFLGEIKRLSATAEARTLPPASEACTSGGEIVRQIEQRLHRLEDAAGTEPALADFLARTFRPAFLRAETAARAKYAACGLAFEAPLAEGLSLIPADFGFHNALRGPDGRLTFIDFEYFGWDDPVKLIADFLLHPAVRLDEGQRERFRERMCAIFAGDPHFVARLRALTPLFALRWALILLNEFLPERWSGRAFARGDGAWAAAKERQLLKAHDMMKHSIREASHA